MDDLEHGLARLRALLNTAIAVEHATIPAYLTALYSIREGANPEAVQVIRGVVVEEMLHMALAANVLNAVGGEAHVDRPDFIPEYPCRLPIGRIVVGLRRFSRWQVRLFRRIEKPEWIAMRTRPGPSEWDSIGAFYASIQGQLDELVARFGEARVFTGDPGRQILPGHYYGGGGALIPVTDLASARQAIQEIERQGEGMPNSILEGDGETLTLAALFAPELMGKNLPREHQQTEFAHYFRFSEIWYSRYYLPEDRPTDPPTGPTLSVDWDAVHPIQPNTKAEHYRGRPEIHARLEAFNQHYSDLLRQIEQAFRGRQEVLREAVVGMYALRDLAQQLANIPSGDGPTTLGPPFQFRPARCGPAGSPAASVGHAKV